MANGHVLFEVATFPDYGQLSRRNRDDMIAGARVEVAPFKRDPADFVLWKPSAHDQPGWDAPWGRGRPGWHVECSAMIERHLGRTIDIHGGGQDLIFPHHENEIAQGTCAHDGNLYCRYWVHNGFVTVDGAKMSKSLGNIRLVRDLLKDAPGEAIRLALLSAHYRQPLDLNAKTLKDAGKALQRLYAVLEGLGDTDVLEPGGLLAGFERALNDDLNTPAALAEMFALAKAARQSRDAQERGHLKGALLEAGTMLGLLQSQSPRQTETIGRDRGSRDTIDRLVADRASARLARDYAEADRLREKLADMGVLVDDRADGSQWRYVA
jgi:cysteinyl-tRNA synthetase